MKSSVVLSMILRPLAAWLAITALAACGQTGPLHQPADAPSKENYLLKRRPAKPDAVPTTAPASKAAAPAADPVTPEASPPATATPTP